MFFPFTSFSGFVLSKSLQPSFVVSHVFSWQVLMMGPVCLSLLCLVPLRIMVLLMVLAMISTEWVTAQSMHSSKSCEIFCYHSRVDSLILTTTSRPSVKPWVWSPPELPVLNRPSMPSLPRWRCLQHWNRTSALLQKTSTLSLHAYPRLKRMQRPSPVVLARQDLGTYLDIVTGPLGPMAQGHLMTVEIRGADLILSQAPKMNMHEVPSYYGSHANNSTLELRIGSITFGNRQTYQPVITPCRPDSYSKQEPSVRTLWPDVKMMVSPAKLIVHFATSELTSRSASPSHLKTGKSENDLRLCGECLADQLKILCLVPSLSLHLMPGHKSSALRIEETVLENLCSNLPLLEVDSCLPLLHLTCVFLVFLVKCCNGSSLKPARPMCDGRPFASPLFCRLAGRGALFRGFPFRWVLSTPCIIFDSQHNRACCYALLQGGSSI